jgi:4-aminobutyrate aminotransferase-like enzyme
MAEWPQRFPVRETPLAKILGHCRQKGLFLMMAHPSVLHLAPPLIIERTEIDFAIETLDTALRLGDEIVQ